MPIIYLSPSTQENNLYVNGGTEEEWMNRLADAMEPYLTASGIRYSRNTPDMTAASSIRASNAGNYDLHLALHSNASPEGSEGAARGIIVFYYPGSEEGQRAATIIANNLKAIYPLPDQVVAQPQKLPQIRRFLDYYLPTTLKILNAYDRMDAVGVAGDNISSTKERVERMMGTIVKAFDKQLDALFGAEAMDISTDITVMENLLAQEGLAGDGKKTTKSQDSDVTLEL